MDETPISDALVIPVHNRRSITLACLRRLRDQGDLAWATPIVVDDGSSDGTGDAVRSEFPMAEIVRGTGSLFWTGATAAGMARAIQRQAAFIFWLNDDCEPRPRSLALLREAAAASGGAAGGVCMLPDGEVPIYGGFRMNGVELDFVSASPGQKIACDALNGNLACFTRAAVDACGLPDARAFPHALGDTDYTLRVRSRGFPVELVGSARAMATPNRPDNHASWLVGDTGPMELWLGLLRKTSYAYLPANWRFLRRHCGWRGGLHCAWLVAKRAPITLLMLTTSRRQRLAWWGKNRRGWTHARGPDRAQVP